MAEKYRTKQRAALEGYMAEHADEALTAAEIAEGLRREGRGCGRSTVYRLLSQLLDEGAVKREADESGQARYRLSGKECSHHLHLRCVECGRVEHMDEAASERILNEVAGAAGFAVDRGETVLLGCCGECRERHGNG